MGKVSACDEPCCLEAREAQAKELKQLKREIKDYKLATTIMIANIRDRVAERDAARARVGELEQALKTAVGRG
jgi:hypothetical protein